MRYARIDLDIWEDDWTRSLSTEQLLQWVYLLSTPFSLTAPGVIRGGPAALAEDFRRVSADVFAANLRAFEKAGRIVVDRERRIIWIPRALERNRATNPNQMAGWLSQIASLPADSSLTAAIKKAFLAEVKEEWWPKSKALREAGDSLKRIGKRSGKPFGDDGKRPESNRERVPERVSETHKESLPESLPESLSQSLPESLSKPPTPAPAPAPAPAPTPAPTPAGGGASLALPLGDGAITGPPEPSADPVVMVFPTAKTGEDFELRQSKLLEWQATYRDFDVEQICRTALQKTIDGAIPKKSKVLQFLSNYLKREIDFGRAPMLSGPSPRAPPRGRGMSVEDILDTARRTKK
ncbi:MAG: hypothetical protein AAF851_05755 [Myxococcota bacterium]